MRLGGETTADWFACHCCWRLTAACRCKHLPVGDDVLAPERSAHGGRRVLVVRLLMQAADNGERTFADS